MPVVSVQPEGQFLGASLRGGVGLCVGPFPEGCLDEALGLIYLRDGTHDETERTVDEWQTAYAEMRERIGAVAAWIFFHIKVFRSIRKPHSGHGSGSRILRKWLRWGLLGSIIAMMPVTYLSPTIRSVLKQLLRSLLGGYGDGLLN